MTSSFLIDTADMESYSSSASGAHEPSRDLDMRVRRPGDARAFALLLFALSWVLTHVTIGHVILARRLTGIRSNLKHVISAGAILVTIPQLRDSMPDAPGLDGTLLFTLSPPVIELILFGGIGALIGAFVPRLSGSSVTDIPCSYFRLHWLLSTDGYQRACRHFPTPYSRCSRI